MKTRLTPSDLEVLIHCHVSPTPHPRGDATSVRDALTMFLREGIIRKDEGLTSSYLLSHPGPKALPIYTTTPYGASLLGNICNSGVTGSRPDGKCLVKGCQNYRDEGPFIGALCGPCHNLISEGEFNGGVGETIFHDMYNHYTNLLRIVGDRNEKVANLTAKGIEMIDAYRTPDQVIHAKLEDALDHQLAIDFRQALIEEGIGRGGSWDDTMIATSVLALKQFKIARR